MRDAQALWKKGIAAACYNLDTEDFIFLIFLLIIDPFLFNRTVDDKPKRPTRKRQAPEDFLGKGPDRKIFMGK